MEERPSSRSAKIWKNHDDLKFDVVVEGQNVAQSEEHIRVQKALKVMRKAYTLGSRYNRERMKIRKQAEVDTLVKGLRKVHGKKDRRVDDQRRFFAETEPIKVKTLDDIIKEAKESFHLARDRINTEEESKKFGILRPICTSLLAEVKEEMLQRAKKPKPPDNREAVDKPEFVVGRISRPKSATMLRSHTNLTLQTGELDETQELSKNIPPRPSSANFSSRKSVMWSQTDSVDPSANSDRKSSVPVLHRASSVGFNNKSILDDERIMKAIRLKETKAQEKEEQLKQKIIAREQTLLNKQQLIARQELQRGWMVVQAVVRYLSIFYPRIKATREKRTWLKQHTADKRAAALIHRWWLGKRMWLRIRRHPKEWRCIVAAMLRYRFRLIMHKKRMATELILRFLRDSSGLSESVRRIYAFRQSIIKIQRWVRSWCDVQIFRVRLLWLVAEKVGRKIAQQMRIQKMKNERSSVKALREMSGFAETVYEIDAVKRQLSKVFDHQHLASRHRDELDIQIKMLNLPSDDSAAANNVGVASPSSHGAKRRQPVLLHQVGALPSLMSSHSQQDLFDEGEGQSSWNLFGSHNNFQHYFTPSPTGGLGSSNGGNLNSSSGGIQRTRSRAQSAHHLRRPSMSSASHDSSGMMQSTHSNYLIPTQAGSTPTNGNRSLMRRASHRKNQKVSHRVGGYSLLALGMVDRYGAKDPDLAPWLKKVRSSPMNLKLYESIRAILAVERKKYVSKLNAIRTKRRANPIDMSDLVAFLRDPKDYSKSTSLSASINTNRNASAIPDIIADMHQTPWLLLTGGAMEAIETLLNSNKYRFVS